MNLTPLHDAWLAQLARQDRTALLLTGAAILVILTVALSDGRYRLLFLSIAAASLVILTSVLFVVNPPGAPLFARPPLWYDEAFTWRMARLPFGQMMEAIAGDVHPPLWYVIEGVTIRLFGDSELALRLPALAFGWLGVFLTWVLALSMRCDLRVTRWAALGLSVVPGWLYYAQEARMYTLLTCAVLVAAIGMVTRCHWLMALGMVVTLYTQTLGVFYVAVIALLALRGDTGGRDRDQIARLPVATLAWLGLVGAAWLPWLSVLAGQVGDVGNGFWIPDRSLGGYLLELYRAMLMIGEPAFLQVPATLVGIGVVALALWAAWRDRERGTTLLALAFVPVVLMALVSEVWRPIYLHRALLPSLPFVVLLVLDALARMPQPCGKLVTGMLAVFLALGIPWQGKDGLLGTDMSDDVAAVYQDGDVIYHVNLASYILLSYYLPEPEYRHAVWPDAGNLSQALTVQTQAAMGIPRVSVQDVDADRLLVVWVENPMTTVDEAEQLHAVLALGKGRKLATWVDDSLVQSGLWEVNRLPREGQMKGDTR